MKHTRIVFPPFFKSFPLLIMVGAALVACAHGSSATYTTTITIAPRTITPGKVRVGVSSDLSYGPIFIAQEEGFFAEQGLEVEFVRIGTGPALLRALEQGQIDVAGYGPALGLFQSIYNTGNIKIVADRGYLDPKGCTYWAVMASADWLAANPTPTAESMRGRSISVDTRSFQAFIVDNYLTSLGLTLDDMQIQNTSRKDLMNAVKTGSLDFVTAAEPLLTQILDTQKMAILQPYQSIEPGMPYNLLLYSYTLFRNDPENGNRFMTAYLEGVRQYHSGKTDRNIEILVNDAKQDPEMVRRICWPAMHDDGTMDLSSISDYQTWAVAKDLVNKVIPAEDLYDPRFVEAADAALAKNNP